MDRDAEELQLVAVGDFNGLDVLARWSREVAIVLVGRHHDAEVMLNRVEHHYRVAESDAPGPEGGDDGHTFAPR